MATEQVAMDNLDIHAIGCERQAATGQVATANPDIQAIGFGRGKWQRALLIYKLLAVGGGSEGAAAPQKLQDCNFGRVD